MARILLIEDNPANLELMTYLLRTFGHQPVTAQDGQAGLDEAMRSDFDLILCDIQLPKLDGYEIARQVKARPALRRTPLVAVTALAMVGDRDRVLAAGFDGYIAKPIVPRTFVAQAEQFLRAEQRLMTRAAPERPAQPAPTLVANRLGLILALDNSPVNLQLIRSTFEPSGYEVVTADTVATALELARERQPDLILSDLHMPGENGYDFIRAVKADPMLSPIPFVFLSSTVWRDADRLDGLALGAQRFLLRPISPQSLLAEVKAAIQKLDGAGE
jgi:two-component system cell cycle response regulator